MSTPKQLFKTTIVIWTTYDPAAQEISELAQQAMDGDAFCSSQVAECVLDKDDFPDTDFFNLSGEPAYDADDKDLSADQLDDKYNPDGDGEHPWYDRNEWRDAVSSGYTISGYWDWVAYKISED